MITQMQILGLTLLLLAPWSTALPVQRYLHVRKNQVPAVNKRPVPFYAELDVSETQYLFNELLSRFSACGIRLEWRSREEFSGKKQQTQQLRGAVLLIATGGPNADEVEYFQSIPEGQYVVLLHPSDEGVARQTLQFTARR